MDKKNKELRQKRYVFENGVCGCKKFTTELIQ